MLKELWWQLAFLFQSNTGIIQSISLTLNHNSMHCKRLINAPLLQTNIAMHLSIWRQHDYIWRFSDATRGGSIGFQRCKIAFYRYTGDYEKILNEAFIQTKCFYIVQLSFFSKQFRCSFVATRPIPYLHLTSSALPRNPLDLLSVMWRTNWLRPKQPRLIMNENLIFFSSKLYLADSFDD